MSQTITREELKKELDSGKDIKIIEVLPETEYKRLHIKGARNIPLPTIASVAKKELDEDDNIVVYCSNTACGASPKAAEKLRVFGFKNVRDYEAGKADWEKAGYPMEGKEAS